MFVLFLCALGVAEAADKKPLHSGEFRNTAQTTEKGEFVLHPLFLRSHYGISDKVDVKLPLLGLIGGLSPSVEINLVDNDSLAFSLEPSVSTSWNFRSNTGGLNARFTKFLGENRFNASAGFNGGRVAVYDENLDYTGSATTWGAPINLGFDLALKDTQAIRFVASTDVGAIANGFVGGVVGANYNTRVSNTFALSVGLAAYVGGNPISDAGVDETLGFNLPAALPLPTFEMWWKI